MAKLAIKGHSTRGSEVIALLEMLGGKNIYNLTGTKEIWYILSNGTIEHSAYLFDEKGFTLEEFLKKFPYKVGNEVIYINNIFCIKSSQWDSEKNTVIYYIDADWSAGYVVETSNLQPYKEEIMETHKTQKEVNIYLQDITIKNAQNLLDIEQHLNNDGLYLPNNIVINKNGIDVFEFTKWYNKPQYPNTFEECCEVLGCKANHFFTDFSYNDCDVEISDYEDKINDLLQNFRKLRYCRYAYWKIAGEEMSLGKPWKPNWTTLEGMPTIFRFRYNIVCDTIKNQHCLLVFPTAEMRDIFYENFKDLIECCKELL